MKKSAKRIIRISVCAFAMGMLFMGATPANTTYAAESKKSSVTYKLKNGTLTIAGKGKATKSFENNKKIKKVIVKKGVTSLGKGMFQKCSKLKKVEIGSTVKTIGSKCFYKTALKSVTLPEKCKKVGEKAFYKCPKLKTIKAPGTCSFELFGDIYDVPDSAKFGDGSLLLPSLVYTTPVKNLDYKLMGHTKKVTFAKSEKKYVNIDGLIYANTNDGLTLECVPDWKTDFTISDKCEVVKVRALAADYPDTFEMNIDRVVIPKNVKKIDFTKCEGGLREYICYCVGSIELQSTDISQADFVLMNKKMNCSISEMIAANPKLFNKSGEFYYTDKGRLFYYTGESKNIVIPAGVKAIDSDVFANNVDIVSVTIPEGVEVIEEDTFWACDNLETVKLSSTVRTIQKNAFKWCFNLDMAKMLKGSNVKYIAGIVD